MPPGPLALRGDRSDCRPGLPRGRKRDGPLVSVGLKVQWKRFKTFESGGYSGDLLRSHPPNLRLDGSEPVSARSRTDDTGRFTALFTIRYAVR